MQQISIREMWHKLGFTFREMDWGRSVVVWYEKDDIHVGGRFRAFQTQAERRQAMDLVKMCWDKGLSPGYHRIRTDWDKELDKAECEAARACSECDGTGNVDGGDGNCRECGGSGIDEDEYETP